MPAFVVSARNSMIDWLTGKTTPAAVATRYITVFNGDPQGAGAEVLNDIAGSPNRPNLTAAIGAAVDGSAATTADIDFTTDATGSATVNHVAIMSAVTGGSVMASAAVTTKVVAPGDGLSILAGNGIVSIA